MESIENIKISSEKKMKEFDEEVKEFKKELFDNDLFKKLENICELKHQIDLSRTKINEKAINKIIKQKPFMVPVIYKKIKIEKEEEKIEKEEKKKEVFD